MSDITKKQTPPPQVQGPARLAELYGGILNKKPTVIPHKWEPGPGATLRDLPTTASRMAIIYGRSKSGKSLEAELLCEMAIANGHDNLAIADFDRDNPSLGDRFGAKQVIRPLAATAQYFELAFLHLFELQQKTKCDAVLDMGFGALRDFRQFALSTNYQLTLEESLIRSVLVLMLTPNLDDLGPIRALDKVFLPRDVILVVNEGTTSTPNANVAFEFASVLNDPYVRGLLKRGARLKHLPRLPNGTAFHNSKRPFALAAQPHPDNPLNAFERAGAQQFLQKAHVAFEAHADLLPIRRLV